MVRQADKPELDDVMKVAVEKLKSKTQLLVLRNPMNCIISVRNFS